MSAITTHVLDTTAGRPAEGIPVALDRQSGDGSWETLGNSETGADGRCQDLLPQGTPLEAGAYRLTFDAGSYFSTRKVETFYPQVTVTFTVRDASQHYHLPLLLSPFGYSTYRGS